MKRLRRFVRGKILSVILPCFHWGLRSLPHRTALAVGAGVGRIAYGILRRHRRRCLVHLEQAFGTSKTPAERKRLARDVFVNLGQSVAEMARVQRWNRQYVERWVSIRGRERIERVLREGRGVIILSAHLGNWELGGATFAILGYGRCTLMRQPREAWLARVAEQLRRTVGLECLERTGAAREVVQRLRRNELVGIFPDQDLSGIPGIFVDFFGYPAYTTTAPALLARRSGAPILPCFIVREGPSGIRPHHTLYIEEPILPSQTGDVERDMREDTARWSRVVEAYIRRYPDQWVWFHKRWKTRPEAVERVVRKGPGSVP